jgi:hypothetical protein
MLRLTELNLSNVGPFDAATVRFLDGADDPRRVALITGENGTGKTVILDAIRMVFGMTFATIERDLSRRGQGLTVACHVHPYGFMSVDDVVHTEWRVPSVGTQLSSVESLFRLVDEKPPDWVTAYWRSEIAHDDGRVEAMRRRNHRGALYGSLQGTYKNVDVAEALVFFDYLRDSRDPEEKRAGEALWTMASRIVESALLDGHLVGIERKTYTPMIEQAGHTVPLANLSSGNAYLIGRMLSLLDRMYSLSVVGGEDPAHAHERSGLLLIDEAENHLHPKWQKRFIPMILDTFPNLQIIATTHSPFVLSSYADARIFVTRYDADRRGCVIDEAPGGYANLPVDEILASSAFDETQPFNEAISRLIEARADAIARGDDGARREAERLLLESNPTYFAWFRLDERLNKVGA